MNQLNIGEFIAKVLTGIISPILDKTVRDPSSSIIKEKIKNGISISSKRLLNLTGTGAIITVGLSLIVRQGPTWPAVAVVALGIAYSIAMAWITKKSEE